MLTCYVTRLLLPHGIFIECILSPVQAPVNQGKVILQVKLINRYFKQHHQVLFKIYKEMAYFSGDFPFESNASFTAFMSSIDSNLSASFS